MKATGWHCITVPGCAGAERAATDIIGALETAFSEAENPTGVDVFHRTRGDGSRVFFLSPMASKSSSMLLLRTAAVPCREPKGQDRQIRVRRRLCRPASTSPMRPSPRACGTPARRKSSTPK